MTLIDDCWVKLTGGYTWRRIVRLNYVYRPVSSHGIEREKERVIFLSGFIFSSRNRWFWVTAGHAIKDLDEHLENGTIELDSSTLVDSYNPKPLINIPIPFDYKSSQRISIFDKESGLDFGLIALRPHYRDLLKANGIVPLAEENWSYTREIHFDHYILLGLPKDFIDVASDSRSGEIKSTIYPTMVFLEKTDYQPHKETTYPRFIAEIRDNSLLEDIEGMSGGPIFGISNEFNDRYWIVAIQNSWLDRKIIFGCPISVFAPLVEGIIDEIADDLIV